MVDTVTRPAVRSAVAGAGAGVGVGVGVGTGTGTGTGASSSGASIGARLDRMPITPTHRSVTAVIGVGLLFDTFENNLSGTIAKVLQDDFAFGATELKLVLASAFIGQFIGSLVLGKIADRYGRRRAFLINLAIYSGFSLLGAFSPNAAWLIVTRFLAGVGIGAEQSLSDCYLSDVLPARKRGRFIAWAYTLAFCGVPAVGFAALWLVPLSPLGIDGWRWLFVIGALGSAVVWVLRRRLIESPRWLAAVGREDEADALVSRMEAEVPGGVPATSVPSATPVPPVPPVPSATPAAMVIPVASVASVASVAPVIRDAPAVPVSPVAASDVVVSAPPVTSSATAAPVAPEAHAGPAAVREAPAAPAAAKEAAVGLSAVAKGAAADFAAKGEIAADSAAANGAPAVPAAAKEAAARLSVAAKEAPAAAEGALAVPAAAKEAAARLSVTAKEAPADLSVVAEPATARASVAAEPATARASAAAEGALAVPAAAKEAAARLSVAAKEAPADLSVAAESATARSSVVAEPATARSSVAAEPVTARASVVAEKTGAAQDTVPATRLRDIFQPHLRRRTVMLWIFCSLSTVGYYGFGTLAPQILAAKGYGIVAGIGFTAVCFLGYPVGSALTVPIIDRFERKKLVAASAASMVVAGLGFSFAGSPALIMVFGFVYTVCSNIFSNVSHVYLAEQYPTAIRAAASGAAYSLSKLSAAALPFVLLPVLQSYGPGALFGVIAAVMAALATTVLSLGERTTGASVDRAPAG
ncbi:MFS transporter [Streptomyces sp. G5(2025)]|uniref:MFS transporter n=1 Tax=Streptomyces sp. G5(2025) TaxID=3406628 RepID=UPI003C26F7F4